MASRLEAATRQFKCRMFASDFFHSLLSDYAKSYCRPVDIVTVKGSVNPMILYTIDVDPDFPGERRGTSLMQRLK